MLQAIESLDISDSLEVTAMTSKEKERVPFDTPMQASGTTPTALTSHCCNTNAEHNMRNKWS